jgi:hypothetical protein
MKTNKNVSRLALFLTLALAGAIIPAAAQEAENMIIFGNDTGAEITGLVLSPAKKVYPRNRNRYAPPIQVNDGAAFAVELPSHLQGITSFDIEVISGNKRLTTQRGVKLDFENGSPFLELTEIEKHSTFGPIGALIGSVATTVFMTETQAGRSLHWGIIRALPPHWRGVTVLLVPVAMGVGGYFVGNVVEKAVTPGALGVQVYYQ